MQRNLPIVFIISTDNILAKSLEKELIEKSCEIINIKTSENLKKYLSGSEIPEYVFYIDGFFGSRLRFSHLETKKIFKFIEDYSPKTQVILPYVINSSNRKKIHNTALIARKIKNRNLQIIYLGELYSRNRNPFPTILKGKKIVLPKVDINLYLIDIQLAVSLLMKGIFSYGFNKKEIVAAYQTTAFNLAKKIQYSFPLTEIFTSNEIKQTETVACFDFVKVNLNEEVFNESIYATPKEIKIPETKLIKTKPIVRIKSKKTKPIFFLTIIIFWVISIPFISLFISAFTAREGIKNMEKFNFSNASVYFNLTQIFSKISANSFIFFDEGRKVSLVMNDLSVVGNKSISFLNDLKDISNSDNITKDSDKLYLEVDDLSRKVSFLSADIHDVSFSKFFVPDFDLQKTFLYLTNSKVFVQNLPYLLGVNKRMNYIVFFQDTNELRATGGLIDSFGIFSFENGKLIDKSFYNTSVIDKSFSGLVEPPQALKKYLGITNWKLIDSNWDTDVSAAAAKAEWFYESETGNKTDGVLFVNSGFKSYFQEHQSNFWVWGRDILNALNSKDITIYLNDNKFSSSLLNLNWDGKIVAPICSENCKSIWISFNESNLGLNKVNPFIERSESFTTNFVNGDINNKYEVDFNNTSMTMPYRVYLRLTTLAESSFDRVTVNNGGVVQNFSPDINFIDGGQEAGLLINIPAGKTASAIFNFKIKNNLNFSKDGKVLLYVRKQPGIYSYPLSVKLTLPQSLTVSGPTSYNTNLTHDENYIISW